MKGEDPLKVEVGISFKDAKKKLRIVILDNILAILSWMAQTIKVILSTIREPL